MLAFYPGAFAFAFLMRSIYPARFELYPPSSSDLTFTKGARNGS
jgi:hypothetical protein